jgi:hypothetical protein
MSNIKYRSKNGSARIRLNFADMARPMKTPALSQEFLLMNWLPTNNRNAGIISNWPWTYEMYKGNGAKIDA